MNMKSFRLWALAGVLLTTAIGAPILAQEAAAETAAPVVQEAAPAEAGISLEMFTVNNTWMMVATFLVFIMHLGFSMIESGLCQAKNTVNILFKNTLIIAIGLLTYALMGFNLMYPDFGDGKGYLAFGGFGIGTDEAGITSAYSEGYTYWTDFLFQGMFAATAATIVSGAVAERIKLNAFLIFSVIFVATIYPIIGSWQWGGGFLAKKGFYDFAGSTLVHSVGGWAALAGVILLGARSGKYGVDGKINPIMGHNMPLATVGMFLLWLGWFGFNGGSVLSADPGLVSYTLVTTSLAASAGIVFAVITAMVVTGKPDLSMALNGALAGLVGITAGADTVSITSAILIGGISGILVVGSVLLLDKLTLDDPVGAISVHLTCGIWGTLAVGIFSTNAEHTIVNQLIGIGAAFALAFPAAFTLFFVLKMITGIRVDEDEELKGLDIGEHSQEAYSGFQIFNLD
jgi:ammonium transporter, Amt family